MIKFEKFLKENEAKRQRANTRAQTEKKIREQKVLEIQHMTYMLADLQIHLEKTRHLTRIASFVILGKYQKYDEFLQSVVVSLPAEYLDTSDPHINDILLRYKTLSETNADLATNARNNTELIEKLQLQLNDVLKKLDNESMVSNAQMRGIHIITSSITTKMGCRFRPELEFRKKNGGKTNWRSIEKKNARRSCLSD